MSEPIRDLETAVRELGALPMPAGPEPKESGPRSFALVGEVVADDYDDAVYAAEQAYSGMRGQGYKGSVSVDTGVGEVGELRAKFEAQQSRAETLDRLLRTAQDRVAELESERHTTNEALSDAAEALRRQRDRIAGLEAQHEWRRAHLVALQNDALNIRGALSPNGEARKVPFELGQTLLPAVEWLIARVAELEAAQSAAEADALELPGTALEHVQAILLAHFGELPRPDMAVGLLLTNLRAEWEAEDRRIMPGAEVREDAEDVTPQVQKLRALLAGQREQAAADAPHEGPQHHTYRLGRDLPETGGAE